MSHRATIVRNFERFARALPPPAARMLLECSRDDRILGLLPNDPHWDLPHRLDAAVEWLVDTREAPDHTTASDAWATYRATILDHADWVCDFVREHRVQTNEVQRCFALLPIFLTVARRASAPLDLLELGASAGLNLLWDRYGYRYAVGQWGPAEAELVLAGEERGPVPADLLAQRVTIRRRTGIDLNPLDVNDADDVRLLRVFTARHRRERLMRAVAVAQAAPAQVTRGDYLADLPALLADRDEQALTVVFQTLSAIYLGDEERARLWAVIDEAGRQAPLVYVWTPTPEEHGQRQGDYPIELAIWPGPERRYIARMENHGEWLDWRG